VNADASAVARSRAMLSLVPAFKAESFRLPTAAELLSLCVAKEKVTKEKGHPASAPCGHPARKVRGRATGFVDRASCPDAKLAGILAGHPAGFPSPARRCRGAPGRAAGHRGPHSSKKPKQQPDQQQCNSSAGFCSVVFAFQLHHRVRATMARCSTGVPCAAVRRGRQAAQRALPGMATPFRAGRSPLEKPGPDSRTCRPWMGGKRQAGWPSLWVTFLLATQEKSNSAAEGRRKLFALNVARARASRTECAPADARGPRLFAIPSANRNEGTFA
jgi:hypothetical protein